MTDFDDDEDLTDADDLEARQVLTREMRTRGAVVAYQTAISICLDGKATAAAKASAVNSLLRAGGFFNNQSDDDTEEKELSEMSHSEISRTLAKARASLKRRMEESDSPAATKQPTKKASAGGLFD